jgi:hypothetical protein
MGEEGEEVLGSGFWVLSSELGVGSWELGVGRKSRKKSSELEGEEREVLGSEF